MKLIEGYICTARSNFPIKQEQLFGPNTGKSDFNHQAFTFNGLVPFEDPTRALDGLEGLRKRRKQLFLTRTGLASVRMEMATSDQELEILYGKSELIIVAETDAGYILLGRSVEGIPGMCHAPVSDLEMNDFKVFKKAFKYGMNVVGLEMFGALYEVRRQGRPVSSTLSTFELERLKAKDGWSKG